MGFVGSPLTPNALNDGHVPQRLHRARIIRDIREDECISRRDNPLQGVAAHQKARGKSGRLSNRTFGAGYFPATSTAPMSLSRTRSVSPPRGVEDTSTSII